MGNGLEVRGNESNSGHYSAANQTAYSGNFLGDPSTTNSHAVIYDRKYSEMNSTTNIVILIQYHNEDNIQ